MPAFESKFPGGEFAAFSTAKMSYFLPVRENIDRAAIDTFFGSDAKFVALTPLPSVELHVPNSDAQIATPGDLIAKFANGKYKVMNETYYHKNFNDPITDPQDNGIF
ncbi:hypothetical protein [Lacticaseibacillus parakribbianus]|uniref:hypothetical protein n=1 Tax=Lacticaseibacillus parakribbianus TaxID=2970927 RepID=UPI0021CB5C46|nr:hypothetical protein [Lacticaseibacillus parakribbianus]